MKVDELLHQIRSSASAQKRRGAEEKLQALLKSSGAPIVLGTTAHFLFEAAGAMSVSVVGDWNGWDPSIDVMQRLTRSSFFHLKKELPIDGRFAYRFVIDGAHSVNDPLNPFIEREVFGDNTAVRMPAYAMPEYSSPVPASVERGKLRHIQVTGTGRQEKYNRTVQVYTPAGFRRTKKTPVLYVHDGSEIVPIGKLIEVLDNLYHHEPLTPHAVFALVPPVDRNKEYMLNPGFASWFAHSLVAQVESAMKVTPDADMRGTMGASLGGLLSGQLGFLYPRVFGAIVAQSPSFWVKERKLIKLYEGMRRLPLRWYMHTGTINDAEEETRLMLNVLTDKCYDITYRESRESHNWANWRGKYAEIVRWFLKSR